MSDDDRTVTMRRGDGRVAKVGRFRITWRDGAYYAEKARADAAEREISAQQSRIAELEAQLADIRKHLIKPLRRGMEIWEELNTQGIKWWPDIQQMMCSKDWKNVNYWLEEHTDD